MNGRNDIRVRQNLRTGHFTKPRNENDVRPQSSTELGEKGQLQTKDKATFCSPTEARVTAHSLKGPEERELVVDSGASMHMLSNKDLSSDELETLRKSRNPTTVIPANGEAQTREEAQVFVHDLELSVTVQIFEDTLAVLSLSKLCQARIFI